MPNYFTLLTKAGLAAVTNAQLTNNKVEITQVAVGDANGTPYQPTGTEMTLRKEVWRGGVSSVEIDSQNPNWIVVEGVIPSTVGGFSIREVGLYDANGTLIAIGNYPDTYKPLISDGSTMDLALRTIIEVNNASSVTLRIDPNVVVASRKYVDDTLERVTTQFSEDLNQRGVNLKTAGAKGDKVNDDTTYLQEVINRIRNAPSIYASTIIDMPAGNYLITSTITLPPYVRLRSDGIVKISFTGTGALFHIYNDRNPQQDGLSQTGTNVGDIFLGGTFILQGTRTTGQIALLIGELSLGTLHVTHNAWNKFSNIYIEKFDIGIRFTQIQTYLARFDNVTISHCNTIIADAGITAQNAGELITWNNCGFHNSEVFLRVSSEINHSFVGCSVDYNTQGIIFSNNKYSTQRFTNCWIEASDSDGLPFAVSQDTSVRAYLSVENSHIFFRGKKGKYFASGNMAVNFTNNEITLNRYTTKETHSLASSSILFDDDVVVSNCNTPIFHENAIGISRKYFVLNQNQDFEVDAVGATTANGFSTSGASVTVSDADKYTGTKCLRVNSGGTNYVTVATEILDLIGSKNIYGQCNFKSEDSALNFNTRLDFYAPDGVTLVKTVQINQNFNTTEANKWYCLQSGFSSNETPFTQNNYVAIPTGASKVKATLTIGAINNDIYIDNFVINGVA